MMQLTSSSSYREGNGFPSLCGVLFMPLFAKIIKEEGGIVRGGLPGKHDMKRQEQGKESLDDLDWQPEHNENDRSENDHRCHEPADVTINRQMDHLHKRGS